MIMPSEKSLEAAGQCWCDEATSSIEMDSRLAIAFAKRLEEKDERVAELEAFIRRYRYNIKQNAGDGTQRMISQLLGDVTPLDTTMKYVVLDDHTHFTYNSETREVHCTHGGWGGTLVINNDGTCYIKLGSDGIVEYDTYAFTKAQSYDSAKIHGIIK
jgi:hypothetical protein